jgi:hypothetical protein
MEPASAMGELLLQSPWARQLTGPQLARIARETQVTRFPAGAVVCREGDFRLQRIGMPVTP